MKDRKLARQNGEEGKVRRKERQENDKRGKKADEIIKRYLGFK